MVNGTSNTTLPSIYCVILCHWQEFVRFLSLDLISSSANITNPLCKVVTTGHYEAAFTFPEILNLPCVCPILQFFKQTVLTRCSVCGCMFQRLFETIIVSAVCDSLYIYVFVLLVRFLCAPASPEWRHHTLCAE